MTGQMFAPPPADPAFRPPVPFLSIFLSRRGLMGLLVAAHVTVVLLGTMCDSATFCEPANLASGIAYLEHGRADLYSVNPPLAKVIAALPVVTFLPLDSRGITFPQGPADRPEFVVGDRLMRANADLYWPILILGRLPGLGWSLLGAWLVCRWAGQLFGPWAGLVALAMWCFEPTTIALAHLVTPDLPAAVMTLAASHAFWRYLKSPGWGRALAVGALLGAALLTKFTLLVLVPTFTLLGALALVRRPELRWGTRVTQLFVILLVALDVVNLGYGLAGTGTPLGEMPFVSRLFTGTSTSEPGETGNRLQTAGWGWLPSPLPRPFLQGIDVQKHDLEKYEGRQVYLKGEWKVGGWYHYYLVGMLVKLPVGMGLVVLLGLGWLVANARRFGGIDFGCVLLVSLALLTLVSSQKALNRHFRYVLPALPGLIVVGGAAASWAGSRPWRCWTVAILLGLQAGSVTAQAPHTLAYFNELAGGSEAGYRHLSGSCIDWGQDLWWLKRWRERHPHSGPLYLASYGLTDPRILRLGPFAAPPPGIHDQDVPASLAEQKKLGPWPGRYAVSVLCVQGTSMVIADGRGGTTTRPPFAFAYLRHFQPIAIVGTSLWVYDISLEEANRVRALYGLSRLTKEDGDGGPAR